MVYLIKTTLIININLLGEKLQEVSHIVKTTNPECYLELEKNIQINFAKCKIKTLRVLQKITNDFFCPKPARAVACKFIQF